MTPIRMTYSTAIVLQALARGIRYGFDVADATGLRGGTVYPILRRLEEQGLVASSWEDVERARAEGRPSRKYYRLLPAAEAVVAEARQRFPYPVRGSGAGEPRQA